ncbi:MAG: ComEC/Rec2 family competence protein [Bacillota bacterium]|nr:ComEC/Rec2 family competence protein [Bacillota bacterium]
MMYFNFTMPPSKIVKIQVLQKERFYGVGSCQGRLINLTGNLSSIKEGEEISVKGSLKKENNYERGIIGSYNIEQVKDRRQGLLYKISNFKENIYNKFSVYLGKDDAGIIMSLCVGDTKNLPEDAKNNFKQLGVVHAVSVSGMHIALIYQILEKIFGLWPAIFISLFYVIFTGSLSATVRSFIMIAVFKLSKKNYKNYDSYSSLSLSACMLLILKPYYIFDIGFMLSYLATLGILLYYKKISRALYRLPQKINEPLSVTLSAQVFSMPYAAFTLKNFSGGFIIGNLILVPFYSAIVILGNLAIIVFFSEPVFTVLCKLLLMIMLIINQITKFLMEITPNIVYMTYIEALGLIIVYLCYLFVKYGYKKARYIPIIVLILVIMQNYYFFPELHYVVTSGGEGMIINYKFKSIYLSKGKLTIQERNELKQKLRVGIFKESESGIFLITLNKYKFNIDENRNYIELSEGDKKIIYTNEGYVYYKGITSRNSYDIIKIDKKKYKKYELPKESIVFKVISGRIIALED